MFGVHVADGVRHCDGMFGEYPIVSGVLALKPEAVMRATTDGVFTGTYEVVESIAAVPKVIVTFGVTVNVAVPTFPLLSVTLTVCAPATPARVVVEPAGIWNKNTDVPCSVVAGATGKTDAVAELVVPAILPTSTVLIIADGPKPDTVAVTHVPTGPELGDSVTVPGESPRVVVAWLFHWSVMVKIGPAAPTFGRLTVAVTLPPVILLLLRVVWLAVLEYEPAAIVIGLPEKVAAVTLLSKVVTIVVLTDGYPEAETVTDEPAVVVDGVTVTVGAVIVNVPATTLVEASLMITVCAPTARL